MMIVTHSRIESPWNWDLQSKAAVCFNSFRNACAEQYSSSKSSIYRLNHHHSLCCPPAHPEHQAYRFTSDIHGHVPIPIRQAAVERFSPIHF